MSKIHVNVWVKFNFTKELLALCPIDREGKDACECTPQDDFDSQVRHFYENVFVDFKDRTGHADIQDIQFVNVEKTYLKERAAEFLFDVFVVLDDGASLESVIKKMVCEMSLDGKHAKSIKVTNWEVSDAR